MNLTQAIAEAQARLDALKALEAASSTLEGMGLRVEVSSAGQPKPAHEEITPKAHAAKAEAAPEPPKESAWPKPLQGAIKTKRSGARKGNFKSGPRWTEAEDDKAVQMAAQGYSASQIGQELDRPTQGTSYRLRKTLRSRVEEARERLAVPPSPIQPPCSGFTPEMDARLSRYMADGLGIGGAASMLKIHRDKVQARWDALAEAQEAAE